MTFSVYILKTPKSNRVLYVGCTTNTKQRYTYHKCNFRKMKQPIPIMEVVQAFQDAIEATDYEYSLIRQYRKEGFNLQNAHCKMRGRIVKPKAA